MKTKFTTTALILASGLIASTSFAAEPLTRADVKAEYYSAKAAGTLPAVGIRDNLSSYPAQMGVAVENGKNRTLRNRAKIT